MAAHQDAWTERLSSPEAVALRALGFLSKREADLQRLLADTGLSREQLRRPLQPRSMHAILDFLISHEKTLLDFARAVDLPPEAAYEARRLFNQETSERRLPPYLNRTPSRPVTTVPV